MLDTVMISKLKKEVKNPANILRPDTPGVNDNGKKLEVAVEILCSFAQNLIDNIAEHNHLKKAKILLLVKVSPTDTKKLKNGERVKIGTASKAGPKEKLLSAIGGDAQSADFIVTLSGDWLESIGFNAEGNDMMTTGKVLALIDHELLHCSAKIAGQFITADEIKIFVKSLGPRHIETCKDFKNEEGEILVRYYTLDDNDKFTWKIRRHDVEEFEGVIDRFGKWDSSIARLVDVIHKNEKTLFDKVA